VHTPTAPLRCVPGVRGPATPSSFTLLATSCLKKPRKDGLKWKRLKPAQRLREKDMTILEVNIRGLRSNIGELSNLCHVLKPSIIVIVETFLDATVNDGADCINIPGYSLSCRRDRPTSNKGGIAIYCLEGIAIFHDSALDPEDLELMWFSVTLKSQKILFAAVYRPPSANSDIISYLNSTTLSKLSEFNAQSVVLLGDFNVHHEEWLGSRTTDAAGRRTLEMCNALGLTQFVKEPTREDQILDLVITDLDAICTVHARLGTSDHHPVHLKLNVPLYRDRPYKRRVWQYDKADYWGMRGFLSSADWSHALKSSDPEAACNNVTTIISDAMEIYIPAKIVSKKTGDKVWFDDHCKRAATKKRRLFRKLKKNNTRENKDKFTKARKEYNHAEKVARRSYNNKLRKELSDGSLSSKKWWNTVNTLSGKPTRAAIPVLKDGHQVFTTSKDKAEKFCQTFAAKCQLASAEEPAPKVQQSTTCSMKKIAFKVKDIRKLLRNLEPDKATGPDEIPARILKECSAELARPLSLLFELCFSKGVFPSQWKTASVIPVHKRDSKSNPSMYRPISLLCIISKIMEAAVQNQLQKHLLGNQLISDRQFGFRPHHSTADILTILTQEWSNSLDRGNEVRLIALDIKGAFDKVWHNGLCSKLMAKGVSGKLLTWIRSYLTDRSIKVVLSGQSSSTSSINASVPQGSILGPLLFSVFIDDLGDECENQLYLYADDSTLFCEITSTDDPVAVTASLNRDLEKMRIWADTWKVTFEPSKCKAMTISRKRNPTKLDLLFGTTKLVEKEELEILGVTVDSKLTWTKHISNVSSRAGQKLGALRRVSNKLDVRGRATVYKAQVRSVMEYASLSWMSASTTTLGLLDSIQRKALRIIGVSEEEARTELNITSLHQRRQVAAATVLYKMHTSLCPPDLKALLPKPFLVRRATRSSLSMPCHALTVPVSRTISTGRTFIHTAVRVWNSLPDKVVGDIYDNGAPSFKSRVHKHLMLCI